MKLSEMPLRDLLRAINASVTAIYPDAYARQVLNDELERRLNEDDAKHAAKQAIAEGVKP